MFPSRIWAAVAVVASIALPALAQQVQLPSAVELDAITARGRLLYEYDQAAWHSTDAVMATHPPQSDVGRYIARKTDRGWEVAFGHLNQGRDAFLIAVLATQGKSPEEFSVKTFDSKQADTGFYLAAARCMESAVADFHGAKIQYNIAALPASANQFYIYFLPAQTQAGVFPLGADVRYLVSAGGAIADKRQMHLGLIPNGAPAAAGSTIAAGYHSHALSDLPEDSDVFHVLARTPSMPEFIATEIATYEVNPDGSIRIVDPNKK